MDPEEKNPKELTPEERLFKIIQEAEKGNKDETLMVSCPEPRALGFENELQASSAAALSSSGSTKLVRSAPEPLPVLLSAKFKKFAAFVNLNRLLSVALLALLAYLFSDFWLSGGKSPEIVAAGHLEAASSVSLPPNLFSADQASGVEQASLERSIFQPYTPPPPSAPASGNQAQPAKPEPQGDLAAASQNLRISGIFMGEKPEALIEGLDDKRTYVASVGTKIKGVTVKEIRFDEVVLSDGNAEITLQ